MKYKSYFKHDVGVTIAKIRKGQEVSIECVAVKGIGKDHSKWTPVSVANYQFIPKIKLDKKKL